MRFDDETYLIEFKKSGEYPAIHDDIFAMVKRHYHKDDRAIDLGCSTGLLTDRLNTYGIPTIGVDASVQAIHLGQKYGLRTVNTIQIKVAETTMPLLVAFWKYYHTNMLVARRIMPELFGDNLPLGKHFAQLCAMNGITKIILNGRVETPKAINPLSNVLKEIDLFAEHYQVQEISGQVAYLKIKTAV